MRNEILHALLFIIIPMFIVQAVYRIADRNGKRTKALAEKHPFIKNHRNAIQVFGMVLVVCIIGVIYLLASRFADVPREIFYIVCGIAAGIVNGAMLTLVYIQDK